MASARVDDGSPGPTALVAEAPPKASDDMQSPVDSGSRQQSPAAPSSLRQSLVASRLLSSGEAQTLRAGAEGAASSCKSPPGTARVPTRTEDTQLPCAGAVSDSRTVGQ